jgi:hypothetical protein
VRLSAALPPVPTAPASCGVGAAGDKAQQPQDENDERDPPKNLDGEAYAEQQQSEQQNYD